MNRPWNEDNDDGREAYEAMRSEMSLDEIAQEISALRILMAALEMAPSEDVRDAFRGVKRLMDRNRVPFVDQTVDLCRALLDGLEHGNWPGATMEEGPHNV